MAGSKKPFQRVFIGYSPEEEDEPLKAQFLDHLKSVVEVDGLDVWTQERIGSGAQRNHELAKSIKSAEAALLLVSPSLLTSAFLNDPETLELLRKRALVVPIMLRACTWKSHPWLGGLSRLPSKAFPFARYKGDNRDKVMAKAVSEIAAMAPTHERSKTGSWNVSQVPQAVRDAIAQEASPPQPAKPSFEKTAPTPSKAEIAKRGGTLLGVGSIKEKPVLPPSENCIVVVWTSDEKQRGQRYVVPKVGLSIGRNPDNDIAIDDMTVSGYHCRIIANGEKLVLHDCESTNGTFVDEVRIVTRELSGGEQIWLSTTVLKYLTGKDITAQFVKIVNELATTDNVTGVYNARYLRNELEKFIDRSTQKDEAFTILALAVDHAREIENSYGDAILEGVLVEIVRRLKAMLPPEAIVGRDGAVGFIVALPQASLAAGTQLAKRIVDVVSEHKVTIQAYSIPITVSVGVAELSESASGSDLVKLARERRHAGERAGGNRVAESASALRRMEDAEWMLRKMLTMDPSGAVAAFEIEDEISLLSHLGPRTRDEWYKQLVEDVEAYIREFDMIATWHERYVLAGLLDRSEIDAAAVARSVREHWTSRPVPDQLQAIGARALRSAILGPDELRGFKNEALDEILTRLVQRNDTSPEAAVAARLPFPIAVTPAVVESRPTSLARIRALAWGIETVLRFAVAVQLSFLATTADSGLRSRVAHAVRPFSGKALSIGEWDDLAYKLALLCVPAQMGPLACVPQLLVETVAGRTMRSPIGTQLQDHIKRVGRDSGSFDRPEDNDYDKDEEESLRMLWNLLLKHLRPLGDCRLVSVHSMEPLDNEEGNFSYLLRELRGISEHFTIKGDTLNAALLKECCYLLAPERPPLSLAPLFFTKTCTTCRRTEVFVADELILGPRPDKIPVRGVTSDHEMSVNIPKRKWMDELYELFRAK